MGNAQVCYTKEKVSLDLRVADGMSFKTHLQVIDTEITYDILLLIFMEENCFNTGFYRTQEVPREEIEIKDISGYSIAKPTRILFG
jgi:hypothetical protein